MTHFTGKNILPLSNNIHNINLSSKEKYLLEFNKKIKNYPHSKVDPKLQILPFIEFGFNQNRNDFQIKKLIIKALENIFLKYSCIIGKPKFIETSEKLIIRIGYIKKKIKSSKLRNISIKKFYFKNKFWLKNLNKSLYYKNNLNQILQNIYSTKTFMTKKQKPRDIAIRHNLWSFINKWQLNKKNQIFFKNLNLSLTEGINKNNLTVIPNQNLLQLNENYTPISESVQILNIDKKSNSSFIEMNTKKSVLINKRNNLLLSISKFKSILEKRGIKLVNNSIYRKVKKSLIENLGLNNNSIKLTNLNSSNLLNNKNRNVSQQKNLLKPYKKIKTIKEELNIIKEISNLNLIQNLPLPFSSIKSSKINDLTIFNRKQKEFFFWKNISSPLFLRWWFRTEIQRIINILKKFYNKEIEVQLIRLYSPSHEPYIITKFLSKNSRRKNSRVLFRKLWNNITIYNGSYISNFKKNITDNIEDIQTLIEIEKKKEHLELNKAESEISSKKYNIISKNAMASQSSHLQNLNLNYNRGKLINILNKNNSNIYNTKGFIGGLNLGFIKKEQIGNNISTINFIKNSITVQNTNKKKLEIIMPYSVRDNILTQTKSEKNKIILLNKTKKITTNLAFNKNKLSKFDKIKNKLISIPNFIIPKYNSILSNTNNTLQNENNNLISHTKITANDSKNIYLSFWKKVLPSLKNRKILNLYDSSINHKDLFINPVSPGKITGVKIRIAGRLLSERLVPKRTVRTVQVGSLDKKLINITEFASFKAKNKRGAFNVKIWISYANF